MFLRLSAAPSPFGAGCIITTMSEQLSNDMQESLSEADTFRKVSLSKPVPVWIEVLLQM